MRSFMKSLKEYMIEGLLDRVKNKEVNHEAVVKEFLENNYEIRGSYTIKTTNKGHIVDVKGSIWVKNQNITSLTNRLFEFGTVSGDFKCDGCNSLKTLEGAPKEVGEFFYCNGCNSLKTLEGAPERVEIEFFCHGCKSLETLKGAPEKCGRFDCSVCKSLKSLEGAPEKCSEFMCYRCDSLTSLKGAPKEVWRNFDCTECNSLKSLKGAPKKVGDDFMCSRCKSLKSLEGAPKEVGVIFCTDCGVQFTEDDVKKYIDKVECMYV